MRDTEQRQGHEPVTIVILDRKRDQVFREKSLIAFQKSTGKILAVGEETAGYRDKGDDILVRCPFKHGVIADYTLSQAMLRAMLTQAQVLKSVLKPTLAFCVPPNLTEVERRAFEDALYQCGVKKVLLLEESLQDADRTLPSSCQILMGILPEQEGADSGAARWTEPKGGTIPPGDYQRISIESDRAETVLVLSDQRRHVRLRFQRVHAVEVLEKESLSVGRYSEQELERFRAGKFQSVLYQVETETAGWKRFIIIAQNHVVEVAAEQPPEVAVSPVDLPPEGWF